jgi:hypothetical protein
LVSFPGLDRPVQRGSRDLERPANLRNGVSLLVEIPGNFKLFPGEGFRSAAYSSSLWQLSVLLRFSFPNVVCGAGKRDAGVAA